MPQLFGAKLKHLRQQHSLTQVELARRLGLAGHGHVTNLETGKDSGSLALILRVAYLFNISTDKLLRDTVPVDEVLSSELRENTEPELETFPQLFGLKLRQLRRQRGLTQVELAQQINLVRQSFLSKLESASGKVPSLELIVKLADSFEVSIDYLLKDTIPIKDEDAVKRISRQKNLEYK